MHPGPVDTEMFRAVFPDPAALNARLARVPMKRVRTIEEIVHGVLFLPSDEVAYISALTGDRRPPDNM